MTARGPYYASLTDWVAQRVGGTVQYGNGEGSYLLIGKSTNNADGTDYKNRGLVEISATDVAAFLASATSVDTAILTVYVGDLTCIGSRGATIRILAEVLTTSFNEKATGGGTINSCLISSGTGAGVWGISNYVDATQTAFHSSGTHSTSDALTFDITAILEARRIAGDTSALRFRLIAANSDGTGYDETNASRRISLWSRHGPGGTSQAPALSGTISIGNVAKSLTDAGAGADTIAVTQSGSAPSVSDAGVGIDVFTRTIGGTWRTATNLNGSGRGELVLPVAGAQGTAILTAASLADISLRCRARLNKVPLDGSASFMLILRGTPTNCYRARMVMGGQLRDIGIIIEKVVAGVVTQLQQISDIRTLLAGTDFWMRFQAEGSSPTELSAKIWRWGEAEPGWMLHVNDSSASLQSAAPVGLGGRLSATVSNAPITLRVDQFEGFAP